MSAVRCPRCSTVVSVQPGQAPQCPSCGFGQQTAPAAPAAYAPQADPYAAPAQQAQPGYGAPTQAHRPGGVTAVAVYDFIGAGFGYLFGLLALVAGSFIAGVFEDYAGDELADFMGGLIIVFGIFAIAFATLSLFMGLGCIKGQNWARILHIVFAIIGALGAVLNLATGEIGSAVWSFLTSGLILWAMFYPPSVAWFQRGRPQPYA